MGTSAGPTVKVLCYSRPMLRRAVALHWPELLLVLVGCALRLELASSYDVRLGYDFYDHATNIAWWMQHFQLPAIDWSRAAYHPPAYYVMAGLLARAGVGLVGLGVLSLALGCLRLALLAVALKIYLPAQRMGRIVALALAAVLPASVQMDSMLTNETLLATLATIALVLVPQAFRDSGRARWPSAVVLGCVLSLALLTKVSSAVLVLALCAAAALRLAHTSDQAIGVRVRGLLPVLAVLGIALLGSGWYFAWCKLHYGKAFVTGYDSWRSSGSLLGADIPYWRRRPPGYLLGWSLAIYRFPFYPSAALPNARFFPQLVATTFADYYNYGLAPYPGKGDASRPANTRPIRPTVVPHAVVSVAGGTIIAAITVASWIRVWIVCWRRREHGLLALLLVPLLAVAGQTHFAVTVANDAEGLVKGSYLQFAAAPLFAVFGLGVAWLWRRRAALAVVPLGAVACVAWYLVFCLFFA
jgi:hypothetical protein